MKTMLVTGASSGLGRAVALHFAARGYTVCALARSREKLAALAEAAKADGHRIVPCPADVRHAEEVESAVARCLEECGAIDVLVNNAGINPKREPTNPELIDRVIDTNLKGAMYTTFAVLPAMQAAGGGHVVNIASIAGVDVLPRGSDGLYGASKHGLVAFSELVGKKYRSAGIRVTALCPGGIDTPLWNQHNPYPFDTEEMIRPEEVAELIEYVLAQPRRTLFKSVVFVPAVEEW